MNARFEQGVPAHERVTFALMLAQAGKNDAAIDAYQAALAAGVDSLELRYNLGGLLRRAGQPAEAATHFERAAAEAPQDPDIQVEWGLSLQSLGRHAEAITRFEQAIALAPDRLEATAHLPSLIEQSREALAGNSR